MFIEVYNKLNINFLSEYFFVCFRNKISRSADDFCRSGREAAVHDLSRALEGTSETAGAVFEACSKALTTKYKVRLLTDLQNNF